MAAMHIGIIGCGVISDAYFTGAARSGLIKVKACADLRHESAQAKAAQYGVDAVSVEALVADPDIEIVLNLTVPAAHGPVSLQIIDAGKHVYLEKPLAAGLEEARGMLRHAAAKGRRIGCAPDTFFGAAHQASRRAIDAGVIGQAIGGSVAVLSHGMESWHPNPAFSSSEGPGRSMTWGRITSPSWSICWGRSCAFRPVLRSAIQPAPSPANP